MGSLDYFITCFMPSHSAFPFPLGFLSSMVVGVVVMELLGESSLALSVGCG